MKYFELHFHVTPCSEAATDILAALLAEVGCEAFVPDADGLVAYVQQSFYDEAAVSDVVAAFPLPDTAVSFTCQEAPDCDWNATWEAEGFEPIALGEAMVIHDDRHTNYPSARIEITIHPQQAFGTGTHQTTRMILAQLLELSLEGANVIDAGCGTGILGIAAMKLGAKHVWAYDIDEWSVRNAQENFGRNFPSPPPVTILHGDSSLLKDAPKADVVLANINRNILLADMPAFVRSMKPGGRLILSGFLADDVSMLEERASTLGLVLSSRRHDGDWQMLQFQQING